MTAPLWSTHPLLPIWRWWSYSTIQYLSLQDEVAHVGVVACLRPQETAVSWVQTPATSVIVENPAAGLPFPRDEGTSQNLWQMPRLHGEKNYTIILLKTTSSFRGYSTLYSKVINKTYFEHPYCVRTFEQCMQYGLVYLFILRCEDGDLKWSFIYILLLHVK